MIRSFILLFESPYCYNEEATTYFGSGRKFESGVSLAAKKIRKKFAPPFQLSSLARNGSESGELYVDSHVQYSSRSDSKMPLILVYPSSLAEMIIIKKKIEEPKGDD